MQNYGTWYSYCTRIIFVKLKTIFFVRTHALLEEANIKLVKFVPLRHKLRSFKWKLKINFILKV